MGKVITSAGLPAFAESGAYESVKDHKSKTPNEAAPLQIKADVPTSDLGQKGKETTTSTEAPKAPAPEADDLEGFTEAEKKLIGERVSKIIGKKTAAAKAAEALAEKRTREAEDAERFAESQYNERKLAESRANALEEQLKLAKPEAPEDKEAGKPKIADFTDAQGQVDWDKYTDAKADWAADQKISALKQEQAKKEYAAYVAEVESRTKANADEARKAFSDFDDVMGSMKGTAADNAPNYVLNYLSECENPAFVALYLARPENAKERADIYQMAPIRGIAALGKLEARITAPKVDPKPPNGGTPPLPPPIHPLEDDGTAGINTDPSKMSYKELRAYEKDRRKRN